MNRVYRNEVSVQILQEYGISVVDLITSSDNTAYFYAEEHEGEYLCKVISGDFTNFGLPDMNEFNISVLAEISEQHENAVGKVLGRNMLKKVLSERLSNFKNGESTCFNALVPMSKMSITFPDKKMWIYVEINSIQANNKNFLFGKVWDSTNLGIEYDLSVKNAYFDMLTKIYNRNALQLHLENDIDYNNIIVLLDIDNFKYFNSKYGIEFGDKVLQHFTSQLLKICKKAKDIKYYRMNGDEFLLRMKSNDISFVNEVLLNLKRSLKSFTIGNITDRLYFSFGIVRVNQIEDRNINSLLHIADENMRNHKKSRAMLNS